MRKLIYAMNVSLDGYIAAPGGDLNWSDPVEEVFGFWREQMRAISTSLYGRRLYETMYPYWQTADQEPGATEAEIDFARTWQSTPKVVFSSTLESVGENARLVTGDPGAEIRRLKQEDGGPMEIGGATLAATAMRAGLVDEYLLVTYPVLVGGGLPFFATLEDRQHLELVETRQFPAGVQLTRYAVRRP